MGFHWMMMQGYVGDGVGIEEKGQKMRSRRGIGHGFGKYGLGVGFLILVFSLSVTVDSNEIDILNVHSHPQAGDIWTVSFETTGTADLTIIPMDQATIDDLDFAGSMIYASVTTGAMSSTAPTEEGAQIQRVGVAMSADILFFDPSIDVGEI